MSMIEKYAQLLVHYCLELQKGDQVFVQSTTLATDLVREIYRQALRIGAHVEVDLLFSEKSKVFFEEAQMHQLEHISPLKKHIFSHYDAFLFIRAPFNLYEDQNIDPEKRKLQAAATQDISNIYAQRTADGSMRRSLCQFPTEAAAQQAGMALSDYKDFVYRACCLHDDDPADKWIQRRLRQQTYVDYLNHTNKLQYLGPKTDITFSVKDRIWINSDGRTNMPSGEVFSGPVEESVNGTVFFDYPAVFMGEEVQGVTLTVVNGKVTKWHAEKGQNVLDQVMQIPGAQYFGEVAVGTNYDITQATKNILFDEKIGGTMHMALGQSYIQTGGKNQSAIHWDLISDMTQGQIIADDEKIYENGQFLIE